MKKLIYLFLALLIFACSSDDNNNDDGNGDTGNGNLDTTAPVITVTPGTDTVEQGITWTDAGATSDGGETVNVSGTVDTNTLGTYTITYSATDAAGNTGTATRTVTVIDPPGLSIGDLYEEGYIFYLDGNGGGLIAYFRDLSFQGHQWGCSGTVVGAEGTAIGTGAQNTINIIAECTTPGIAADAASINTIYSTNYYLPSKDELNLMYLNIGPGSEGGTGGIGDFQLGGYYWSSSEIGLVDDSVNAWGQHFNDNGIQTFYSKSAALLVRPVRAF